MGLSVSPAKVADHENGLPSPIWKWIDKWRVNPEAGGGIVSEDPEGWVYAFDWPSKGAAGFSPKMGMRDFVRRRLWERTRQVKGAVELAEYLISKGFDEHTIMTLYERNLKSDGLIDLVQVDNFVLFIIYRKLL